MPRIIKAIPTPNGTIMAQRTPRISPTRLEVQSLPSELGMGEMGSASLFHFFILRMMA